MNPDQLTVVLTRNWAFYLRDGRCVAARDRQAGALVSFHEAVGGEVLGSVHGGSPRPHHAAAGGLRLGEALCVRGRRGLFTSQPILGLEQHERGAGQRLMTRLQHTPAAAATPRMGAWQQLQKVLRMPLWSPGLAGPPR